MSRQQRNAPRKPAIKFAHLRKRMEKNQLAAGARRKKKQHAKK